MTCFFFVGFLGTGGDEGHGSGTNRPSSNPSPRINAPTMRRRPRAKQLSMRGRDRWVAVRRATWVGGIASNPLTGKVASAWPPTLSTHTVATAIANHSRSARAGSTIFVWCHCHPPRLVSLKPPSIQLRIPYHTTFASWGARSLTTSQTSWYPSSHRASRVHDKRLARSLKHSISAHHAPFTVGTAVERLRKSISVNGIRADGILSRS